jgi:alkylhydroperoxidase family enzyme
MTDHRVPRIAPAVQVDPQIQELLDKGFQHEGRALNAAATMAHHPLLLKRFTLFAGLFLSRSLLPERDREIVTLRCAHRFDSDYYFGHHTVLAIDVLSSEEIARTLGPSYEWEGFDRLLVQATDELAESSGLSDATWAELTYHYHEAQMLDLVMLVGFYRMTCLYVNTIGVEREPGIPGWPSEGNQS